MKLNSTISFAALGLLVAAAACNGSESPGGDDTQVPIESVGTFDAPDQEENAAGGQDDEVLEVIEVADGIARQVTRTSVTPTTEFTTRTGSYLAIWVNKNGTSSVFEGLPEGASSALKEVQADSPQELFAKLAPEGMIAPAELSYGRRFSELEAETAARLAKLSPEELAIVEDAEPEGPQFQALAATSCSKDAANNFYSNYRPGVLDDSEGVLEYSASNYQYREARRRKDYQAFFQTNFDQWTPQQPPGGLQAAYFRATAVMCSGAARLTMWRCLGNQATADNGCGESGSTIAATFGPFSMTAGNGGVYKDWPGGDISRARLDQMGGASDHAMWSVMSSNSSYTTINNCYN